MQALTVLAIFAFSVAFIIFIVSLIDYFRTRRMSVETIKQISKHAAQLQLRRTETEMKNRMPAAPTDVQVISLDNKTKKLVTSYISELPKRFDIEAIIKLEKGLGQLGEKIENGRVFLDIAKNLEFTQKAEFGALLNNPTLKLSRYLNGYLSDQISSIRDGAKKEDQESFQTALNDTRDGTKKLSEFVDSWIYLRGVASTGIGPLPTERYEQLKHSFENILVPNEESSLNWSPQVLLWQHSIRTLLSYSLVIMIEDHEWSFDYICSISGSGLPLATTLSSNFEKPLFEADSITYSFAPFAPTENKSVLLVDTILQTGKHLLTVKEHIEERGARFAGYIALVDNDMMPKGSSRLNEVCSLTKDRKIILLYKMSELYALWEEQKSEKISKQSTSS